jgi:Cd2+/Zn2+-exporting ATPase
MGTHKLTKKQKKELKRIFLAAICYVVLLILEHTKAIPVVFGNRFLSLLVYLIPYLIVGGEVVRSAFLSIRNHQLLDETFLMVIASIGAFASGQLSEAVAVMLFYQVGEWFQDYAVRRSRGSIQALLDIAPEYANVEREDGTVETVDPDEVQIGDVLVIRPGDKIPVDGTVLEGSSMIYTAALTGEPVPRSAEAARS